MPLNFSSQARACLEWIGHPEGLAGSTPDGISPVLFRSISRRDVRSTQALESKQFVGESKRRNTMSILIEGAADKSSIACHDYPAGLKSMRENSVVPPGLESFFPLSPALKCVRENWVVPPGLRSFFPLFPAPKRWAKLVRPSGAWILLRFVPLGCSKTSSSVHPEGATDLQQLSASLKRYPDTKHEEAAISLKRYPDTKKKRYKT